MGRPDAAAGTALRAQSAPAAAPSGRAAPLKQPSGAGPADQTAASPGPAPDAPQSDGQAASSGGAGESQSAASPPAAAAPEVPPPPPVISPPRVLSTGTMEYPGDALRLTLRRQDLGTALAVAAPDGMVQLRALVMADGTIRRVEVLVSSGSSALDRAASDAVGRWQFAPATRDGTPIDAYVTLRIRYVVR